MSKISKGMNIVELLSFLIGRPLELDLDIKLLFSGIEIGTLKVKGTIRMGNKQITKT